MKILITLCARGGSKGLPNKNIRELNGRPLIDYSIQFAKKLSRHYKDVVIELSTDSNGIKKVASQLGLTTEYTRPEQLASDTAGKVDAIRDVLAYSEHRKKKKFDYILDLDISSPLRTFDDVYEALDIMSKNKEALTLFSVNSAHKNPYFNMVEKNEHGYYQLSKQRDYLTLSRQTAPIVFELNASFYIYRRLFFDLEQKGVITNRSLVYNMDHICFDIDNLLDFEFMDYLLKNNKLPFNLI